MSEGWEESQKRTFFALVGVAGGVGMAIGLGIGAAGGLSPMLAGLLAGLTSALLVCVGLVCGRLFHREGR
jgi:hypothetical protein